MTTELKNLIKNLKTAEAGLQATIVKGQPKWQWPLAEVEKVQNVATEVDDIVSKDLEALLHWPKEPPLSHEVKHKDSELFYNQIFEPRFSRDKDWFKTVGFAKYETPYTIADNWDRKYINATFLVPENIVTGDHVPVVWFMHGGGFVCGRP